MSFEIQVNGQTKKFESAADLSDYYERMKPRTIKKKPKAKVEVDLSKESKILKDDGVAQVFTMTDKA